MKLPTKQIRGKSVETQPEDLLPKFGVRSNKMGYTGQELANAEDYFLLLFSDEIMQTFVEATNDFAKATNRKKWRKLTIPEFKTFLAMVLYLGLVKYPSRGMAWSIYKFYGSEFVKSMMSQSRFEQILSCWHYMNTADLSDKERREAKKNDAFYSVTPFLELLAENFNKWYQAGQGLDIDESCFDFKGRHRARCYNPNKPSKWHFKAYCLNDSSTGYLCNFWIL